MKKKVGEVLIELGITPNLKGFNYICKAIEYISEDTKVQIEQIGQIYMQIAEDCCATYSRVERAIRYAISKMNKDSEAWQKYIGIKNTTNLAVLFTLALKLREG